MGEKLTKRRVDAAKPGQTIWDGELRGFGLRVWASGSRSYFLKYRRGTVQRWYTIGIHGDPWAVGEARTEASRLKMLIAQGRDPSAESRAEKDAETFGAFADRYLTEISELHKKSATAHGDRAMLAKHIRPVLGQLRVKDIQPIDIDRLHRSMKATPYSANRCLALLSHMFTKAERWGLRPPHSNPCRQAERYPETARERYLSSAELYRLGRALAVVDRAGKAPYAVAAIRLLILTGARLNEILSLRWEYIDDGARLLRLPDSKTGAKSIALAPAALSVLQSLSRQKDNPYVICGAKDGGHLINLQKPWRRIRKAANLKNARLHDLRHSFASVAVAGGMSLPLIGSLLGHSQHQTTLRYAHLADDPRLAAAEAVASAISARMSGKSAEIVPLRKNV